jgi:hypothetical protein
MSDEKQSVPTKLVWMNGLISGFPIPTAFEIDSSARADAEPSVGPLAGVVIQWAATFGWMVLISVLLRWFCKRSFVRAWFAAAGEWKV